MEGIQAEVKPVTVNIDLPAIPDFDVPKPNPDGSHTVREMKLLGGKYIDTEVKVRGHVVWIYDCATAVRTPEMTEKDVKKLLEDHPEECNPPHFYLGEQADTPPERGLWVVEYPAPVRKDLEKQMMPEELEQAKAALAALPPFKAGDEVVVTGKWAVSSPRRFTHTDGLLIYAAMENLTTPAEPPK